VQELSSEVDLATIKKVVEEQRAVQQEQARQQLAKLKEAQSLAVSLIPIIETDFAKQHKLDSARQMEISVVGMKLWSTGQQS